MIPTVVIFIALCNCVAPATIHSHLTVARKFTNKQLFSEVTIGYETLYLKLELYNMTTARPYITMNMSRETKVETHDESCRHFPVRMSPYNQHTVQVTVHERIMPATNYFIKGNNMVFISDYPFRNGIELLTTGLRYFLMNNAGMGVHFLETVLGEKQFVAYTYMYPFGATKMFFGVFHNNIVPVSLVLDVPKGYQVITASNRIARRLELNCRMSDLAAVIMPGSAEVYHEENKEQLRIVVDTLYNKTFDSSYMEFATMAGTVYEEYKLVYPTIAEYLMTVVIVPFLNIRPVNYGFRMCMVDRAVAVREPRHFRYYLTLCMVHQMMTDLWVGGENSFYFIFEGLREFYTLKALDKHEMMLGRNRMMKYFVYMLNGDDHMLTGTVLARENNAEYISKPNIIFKSAIFLNMLQSLFKTEKEFDNVISMVFKQGTTVTTESFCEHMNVNRHKIGFPSDSVNFCYYFDRWTTTVGYPIIMVRQGSGKLQLIMSNSKYSSKEPFIFPLQLAVVYETGAPDLDTYWLFTQTPDHKLRLHSRPVKYYYMNPNATSLYRVLYNVQNWYNLFKYSEELRYGTRISIIADSFYFYSERNLHFDICMRALLLLKDDSEHVAWESVDYVLVEMDLLYRHSELYEWFLSFLGQLAYKYYDRHGLSAPVAVRFACKARLPVCLGETWIQLQEFVTYRNIIPSRDAVLCSGMKSASVHYYVFLEYLVANKDRDRNVLLMAMTCFEDRPLLERLIAKIFLRNEFNLSKPFKYRLLMHMIVATVQGGEAVWHFLLVHHKKLQRDYDGALMQHLLETMAKYLASRHHIRIMRKVIKSLHMNETEILDTMKARNNLLKVTYVQLRRILGFQ